MSLTTENHQSPISFGVQRTHDVNFSNDEARLLGSSRRSSDAAAVHIGRPTNRPMTKSENKVPVGGPRPKNTLNRSHANAQSKGGAAPQLILQSVRGKNVIQAKEPSGPEEIYEVSTFKKRKCSHPTRAPSSSPSTDELLDKHNPADITFNPSLSSSQAVSVKNSIKSQIPGSPSKRHGSVTSHGEHRKLGKMMSSEQPRRQRRREANRDAQHDYTLPVPQEPSSFSQPIDISGCDEETTHTQKSIDYTQIPHGDKAKRSSPAAGMHQGSLTTQCETLATSTVSPHFPEPTLPGWQGRGNQKAKKASAAVSTGRNERDYRLDERFIPVNGKRRSAPNNMSSDADELQLGTTVGTNPDANALSLIDRLRQKSPREGSSSISKPQTPIEADTGLEPSNIRPGEFVSRKPKTSRDSPSSAASVQEQQAPWAIEVAAFTVEDQRVQSDDMRLVYDAPTDSYVVKKAGRQLKIRIVPRKLIKIQWGKSGGKVRFQSSKSGHEENILDFEFRKEKGAAEIVKRLTERSGCKISNLSSEQMDKMFKKKQSEWRNSGTSDRENPYDHVNTQPGKNVELQRGPRQAPTLPLTQPPDEGHRGSVVGELLKRASEEDQPASTQIDQRPMPDGLPRDRSNYARIESLRPNHNNHLRRSTRTSAAADKPQNDIFSGFANVTRYSQTHGLGEPWKKPLVYPKDGKKKTTVEFSDLERLDEGEFLNDSLLSFYLRFLEHTLEEKRPDLAKRVYFFNTFFYATLMSTHKGRKGFNYEGVQKWTRNVDLFTFDYIVVPINEAAHWYLAIICNLPALDRNLPISDNEAEPQTASGVTGNRQSYDERHLRSSSLARDSRDEESIDLIQDTQEPDERGARNSFAEMSLDGDPKSPLLDGETRSGPKFEDQDMLDVPHHNDSTTSGRPESNGEAVCSADQTRKAGVRTKKAKRKSGPPAVTKTPPDKPVIITFDSLGSARSSTIRILKDYLREEAMAKRGGMEFEPSQIKGITASQIPQQDNAYDCGVFLLGYVAKFLEDDPKQFITKIIRREYNEMTDWPDLKPSTLRNSIRDQVMKLQREQATERQKERSAQSAKKFGLKQDQQPDSSPTRNPAVSKEYPIVKEGRTEERTRETVPTVPTQPRTRKEVLENAVDVGSGDINEDIKALAREFEDSRESRATSRQTDRPSRDHGGKSEPLDPTMSGTDHKDPVAQRPPENERFVIIVESQSHQDGSAPKSFSSTHATPQPCNVRRNSSNPPTEIQDSQNSQTSQMFANVVAQWKDSSVTKAEPRKVSEETPVVQSELPKANKKRKIGSKVDGHETADAVAAESDKVLTKYINALPESKNRTKAPASKRKRVERQVHRSDEVISIDD